VCEGVQKENSKEGEVVRSKKEDGGEGGRKRKMIFVSEHVVYFMSSVSKMLYTASDNMLLKE
jgi:hypothetical protein